MLSQVLRRSHMYLALFLTPWVLMYTVSTATMNHREFFKEKYGSEPPKFELERELTYSGVFPKDATPQIMARQLLYDFNLDGTHNVKASSDGSKITITRHEPMAQRRITYTRTDGKVVIEKEAFRSSTFLERMHRRKGFQSDYAADDTWACSVDLVILAMLFWAASGLWMWWELKNTRRWGFVCALTGLAMFCLFLFTI